MLIVVHINLLRKSSDYNAGLLLIIWISFVLVFPTLINISISNFYPIPGKVTLIDKVRDKFTENDQKNSQILDQFYTDHPQFAIKDSSKVMPIFMYKYMIKEMNTSEELQPLMNNYKSKMEKQSRLTNYLATLVPTMGLQDIFEELSGHSLSQYLQFEAFTDSENRKWRNYFHPISLANGYLTTNQFDNLPNPTFRQTLDTSKIGKNLVAIVLINTLLTIGIMVEIRRYKIE
jgi:ABC-2 type transport system permease protein